MARPKLGKEAYVHLGLRVAPDLLPALDAYVAAIQQQMGAWDVRIDRGKALRHLVVEGLRRAGYLPHDDKPRIDTGAGPSTGQGDAGGGHALAPVTLGADQTADLEDQTADTAPHGADQSGPKAAPERPTGRTGRKRPAAAKG